ncbi:MAG: peroxide stress protein YaaA [Phycisphaerales bacterium]|nr:peroxide stress protein YaaA [Phycisphaerales bacterium]
MSNMLAILSPAKTMEMDQPQTTVRASRPRLGSHTKQLAEELQGYSAKKLGTLMSISDKLALLNEDRWQCFGDRTNPRGPAAICFRGDVYQGLEAWTLNQRSLAWAQDHVRILSGLYGLLRPMDVIQPYRLEMSTRLKTSEGVSLYEFWGNSISKILQKDLKNIKATALINLASDEYSKALDLKDMDIPVINVKFLQRDGARDKFISFFAKRARGLMARWMSEHRPRTLSDLTEFTSEGYKINAKTSDEQTLIFSRPKPQAKKAV